MKINLTHEAIPEKTETIELPRSEAQEAIEYIIGNFKNIDSLKDTQTYDWGIEGYVPEDNGKPIRKIIFYIRE
jgi:hypothetical protein